MKIQLVKETKQDGQVVYFVNVDGNCHSAHYNFQEAVDKYNQVVEYYQPKTEEVLMEIEIDY